MSRELSLAVVGVDYQNKRGPTRHFGIALCKPGDLIELRPEPKNPYDERAVAVFTDRDIQIGYLSAERCGWIGGMIANGREVRAIFQEVTTWGAVIRVAFDGAAPVLPPPRERSDTQDDPDFYPDEVYPDE